MRDKIIFLLNSPYPYYTGGRETWINNVCNRLIDKYDIDVITEHVAVINENDGKWDDIDDRICVLPAKSLLSYKWLKPFFRSYIAYFNNFILSWSMARIAKKRITDGQKTFIISMDTVFLPLAAKNIKKFSKKTINIISSRGPHAEIYSSYWPLASNRISKLEADNFANADYIWANGYDTQRNIKSKGFDSVVIFNGVDCASIRDFSADLIPDEHKNVHPQLFTVGTLLDLKGYPEMIGAVSLLHNKYGLPVHLYAYGKGDPYRYMEMAKERGVGDYIHFMGERRAGAQRAGNQPFRPSALPEHALPLRRHGS
jgi:glycosyltransferase involved in cell wall biosynthesis